MYFYHDNSYKVTNNLQDSLEQKLYYLGDYSLDLYNTEDLKKYLIEISCKIGEVLGQNTFGLKFLKGKNEGRLPIHIDAAYLDPNKVEYINLFGISQSNGFNGGNTILYDTKKTVEQLLNEYPKFKGLEFLYKGPNGVQNKKPLFEFDEQGNLQYFNYIEGGLFFSNREELSEQYSGQELEKKLDESFKKISGFYLNGFHKKVVEIIKQNEIIGANITPGKILVFDNLQTLHGREPYSGEREIARTRYDDPKNKEYLIKK